jgi:hypothetical protein
MITTKLLIFLALDVVIGLGMVSQSETISKAVSTTVSGIQQAQHTEQVPQTQIQTQTSQTEQSEIINRSVSLIDGKTVFWIQFENGTRKEVPRPEITHAEIVMLPVELPKCIDSGDYVHDMYMARSGKCNLN